jgi:hypothetical protein
VIIVGIDPGLSGAIAFFDAASGKHDGRAEAALIGHYGLRSWQRVAA